MTSGSAEETLSALLSFLSKTAPDLALVVRAWPDLPEPVRNAVRALVEVTSKT
jgi:hypothetical protein